MRKKVSKEAPKTSGDMVTSTGLDLEDMSIEQAAEICGYTPRWIRQLAADGFFVKQPNGRVSLSDVIHGIERSIMGWRPPGYEGYRR